jgi:hypothetical protein
VLVSILETGSPALQDRVLNSLLQFLYDNHRDGAVPAATTNYRVRSLNPPHGLFFQTKFNETVILNQVKRKFLEMYIRVPINYFTYF